MMYFNSVLRYLYAAMLNYTIDNTVWLSIFKHKLDWLIMTYFLALFTSSVKPVRAIDSDINDGP